MIGDPIFFADDTRRQRMVFAFSFEIGQTEQVFEAPREELTKEYIRGDFS